MEAESLDWSDPSRLQRRDGGEVIACGAFLSPGGPDVGEMWIVSRDGFGFPMFHTTNKDGTYDPIGVKMSPLDIIPRPREPRSFEAWVRPEAIGHSVTYNSWNFLLRKPQDDTIGYVRVRITEVVDE